MGAEAAEADDLDDDDVEGIEEHGGEAAGEWRAQDEERHGDAQADDDEFTFGHAGLPLMAAWLRALRASIGSGRGWGNKTALNRHNDIANKRST